MYGKIHQNGKGLHLLFQKRILVYNGDIDMACNFLGDEWFVEDLKQPVRFVFSSPEPYTSHSGVRLLSLRPSTISNIFFSETTGPIKFKFHMEIP